MKMAEERAAQAIPPMPAQIGEYKLVRTWNDTLLDGIVIYIWGEYAGSTGLHVNLGISPQLGMHDAEICHISRGEDPTWHGEIDAASLGGEMYLTAATYNNGIRQRLEASTVCDGGACQQYSDTGQHVTLIYTRPHRNLPLAPDSERPVPVLLSVDSPDVLAPTAEAEAEMARALTRFLSEIDMVSLTKPYSQR
jgi:exosortase J